MHEIHYSMIIKSLNLSAFGIKNSYAWPLLTSWKTLFYTKWNKVLNLIISLHTLATLVMTLLHYTMEPKAILSRIWVYQRLHFFFKRRGQQRGASQRKIIIIHIWFNDSFKICIVVCIRKLLKWHSYMRLNDVCKCSDILSTWYFFWSPV